MSFIRFSSLWFAISGLAVAASIGALALAGLRLGVDFTGGTLMEVSFDTTDLTTTQVSEAITQADADGVFGTPAVTPTDDGRFLIRLGYLEDDIQQALVVGALADLGVPTVDRLTTVGPKLGDSLRSKAVRALTYAAMAIILYLAITFRDSRRDHETKYWIMGSILAAMALVGEGIVQSEATRWGVFAAMTLIFLGFLGYEIAGRNPSLKYGVCAIIALVHDVLITLGIFAIIGLVAGVEIDALFVTALLTIMGFSVHDTIVVFDRVRENIKRKKNLTYAQIADMSLHDTMARSINTSVTTLITLGALFYFGTESIRWFVLALMVGIVIGTYSSIFLAVPLLERWQRTLSHHAEAGQK